jgi:Shedu protein SduA, C-terminal
MPANTPQLVAAARLRNALRSELGLPRQYEVSDAQANQLARLARSLRVTVPTCETQDEARAWVECLYARGRLRALQRLKIACGDTVRIGSDPDSIEEVSSIGANGSIFLKGRGRAWPDVLTVLARADDQTRSAGEYRRRAANRAAQRARRRAPSQAMLEELADYAHPEAAEQGEIQQLERVIDEAVDEKPIQRYLQEYPYVLTTLMRGPDRFSIPQVRLGRDLVADFFIADVDSGGIRWVLVELETPNSDMTLKRSNQLDHFARKGLSQIKEWREWLQDNLDQARRPRAQNGLGLPDIRPQVDGLLLVGRRHRLSQRASKLRRQEGESGRVAIHTYDWLVEQLVGAIRTGGPPGANPYLLDFEQGDGLDSPF